MKAAKQEIIRMAIPNKGRLHDRTVELLCKSGIELGDDLGRKLSVDAEKQGLKILFIRAQDIPELIDSGAVDLGITGQDQVADSGAKLEEILRLNYGHCRLSVAVPEKSKIKSLKDIKDGCRIATSFPNVTKKFFDSKKIKVNIIDISGAAEIMPQLGVSDAIADLVSSGATLKMNRLTEICTIMESEAVIVSSKSALKKSKECIMDVVNAIKSAIDAESKKYLMADVPVDKLEKVKRLFPGIAGPTVMSISGRDDMVAIHVVVDKDEIFYAVNTLKKLGAKGILTLNIDGLVQ